jgi:hypothetical protein
MVDGMLYWPGPGYIDTKGTLLLALMFFFSLRPIVPSSLLY